MVLALLFNANSCENVYNACFVSSFTVFYLKIRLLSYISERIFEDLVGLKITIIRTGCRRLKIETEQYN